MIFHCRISIVVIGPVELLHQKYSKGMQVIQERQDLQIPTTTTTTTATIQAFASVQLWLAEESGRNPCDHLLRFGNRACDEGDESGRYESMRLGLALDHLGSPWIPWVLEAGYGWI